jgi:hemolysin III
MERIHEPKPLLRGWSHAIAAVAAPGATIGMLLETPAELPRVISVMIFGLSMLLLYVVSATYHLGRWHGHHRQFLRTFDHANIFVLIAGTYTPICVVALSGGLRIVVLVGIWLLALFGAGTTLLMLRLPRWLSTSLYIGMGWIVLLFLPDLISRVPLPGLLLILTGGLVCTLGAVIYASRRPNPWPRVFGYHELFHLCVIVANAAFVVAIWGWVLTLPTG